METYIPRLGDAVLARMLHDHSAVLVTGPRSCGKTTTAERVSKGQIRLGLDQVATAVRADPVVALQGYESPLLIDEWQVAPEVLGAVKDRVDRDSSRGQFVVTGSARGEIDHQTWPGTGRLVRLPMFGLTEREIEGAISAPSWLGRIAAGDDFSGFEASEDLRGYVDRALRGGFPEPALRLQGEARLRWLSSYVDQLITRDIGALNERRDPVRMRRYVEAIALNSAGVVDDSTLWQAARINKATAAAYDSLLSGLFVTATVQAWTPNKLKRLVLSPKRYLVDSGLMAGVLGLEARDVLSDGDMLGRLIETFVVAQLRSELALAVPERKLAHLRLPQGRHEIDVIVELGPRRIVAIEIKATASPGADDARHLRWLRQEFGSSVVATMVLHAGQRAFTMQDGTLALPISTLWS